MIKLKLMFGQWLTSLTRRLKGNFYLYLAVLFSVLVLLDAGVFHRGEGMRDKAFDLMLKYRIFAPKPDPDIVIVDINEASLSAFAKEYGRWPWPRQVLGEFVENIQNQRPKAIVFDIVFSDADIYNPDSDAYFNDVIAASNNTFFPILRLDASQDKLSQLKYAQIPGLKPEPEANQDATIAAVLPHFEGALKADRLGTHNVYPDSDGVVREYRMIHQDAGWRLPALPLVVGQYAEAKNIEKIPASMLINWRGKPFSYTYDTFSEVFTDLASKHKKRPQNEFTNKIVIIGSTAPGLFDIKPTAMDRQFPGVEILATAIDNVKHGDYLKVWRGKTSYILLSLLFIWLTTLAFYFNVDRDRLNMVFARSQIGLLVLSYLIINFANAYLDLTAPLLWAAAFFAIAKVYALANDLAMQRWLAFGVKPGVSGNGVLIMPILIESEEPLNDNLLKRLKRDLEMGSQSPNTVEFMRSTQSGIWGLFADMMVINWMYSEDKPEYAEAAKQDADNIAKQLPAIIAYLGLPANTHVRYTQHAGKIVGTEKLASQWRTLFAQAIIKLDNES